MTKKCFKRLSIILILFTVFMFANIVDVSGQEYGNGDYCLHVGFDPFEDGFSMSNISSVKVNGSPWASLDDLFNASPANGNLWTIEIVAGKNGDKYPDISFAGGSLIDDQNPNGYIVYTAVPNPDDTDAANDDFLLTIVIKDTWTGKGDKSQNSCGDFRIRIKDGPPITAPYHNVTSNVNITIIGDELEYHYV